MLFYWGRTLAFISFLPQVIPRYSSSSELPPWQGCYILTCPPQRLTPDSWRWVGEAPQCLVNAISSRVTGAFSWKPFSRPEARPSPSRWVKCDFSCYFSASARLGGVGVLRPSPGGTTKGGSVCVTPISVLTWPSSSRASRVE